MAKKELRVFSREKPEIRAEGEEEERKIVGYAVKWNQWSNPILGSFKERFRKGAFVESIAGDEIDQYAAYQHDVRDTLGRVSAGTLKLIEDDVGLRYEIIPPDWAGKQIESIERGDIYGSSFIFRQDVEEWDEESDLDYTLRTIKKARVYEVGPVTNPAYEQSEAGVDTRSIEEAYNRYKQENVSAEDIQAARQEELRKMVLEANKITGGIN